MWLLWSAVEAKLRQCCLQQCQGQQKELVPPCAAAWSSEDCCVDDMTLSLNEELTPGKIWMLYSKLMGHVCNTSCCLGVPSYAYVGATSCRSLCSSRCC
jgi:hypothetical protein